MTNRQKLVLKRIVELHSEEGIPVGSKAMTESEYFNLSPATIRAVMAELEKQGYIEKTHTSSGRVPTKLGYKFYVDHLITRDHTAKELLPLIDEIFIQNKHSKDLAVNKALELLSELTNYTTIAIGPDVETSKIKKIDFIPTSKSNAIVLIVTDRGHVVHQNISIGQEASIAELAEVIKSLDDILKNRLLKDAIAIIKNEHAVNQINHFMTYQASLVDSFVQAFAKFASENYYMAGMANIFAQAEFDDSAQIKNLLSILDKRSIAKLVGKADGLEIRFGTNTSLFPLENISMITVPFCASKEGQGQIALLGPSRMAYSKIVPLLEYIAANIAKLYYEEEDD